MGFMGTREPASGIPACASSYSQRLPMALRPQWLFAGFVRAYGGGTASVLHRASPFEGSNVV